MREVGVTFGIHGANLHNSIFAPPLGALFEIFPFRYQVMKDKSSQEGLSLLIIKAIIDDEKWMTGGSSLAS